MTFINPPQVLRLPGDVRHLYPGDAVHPRQVHPHRLPHLPSVHHPVTGDNWQVTVLIVTSNFKESNVDELAMELLLLLVILPAVQDQNQGREWLKYLVQRYPNIAV